MSIEIRSADSFPSNAVGSISNLAARVYGPDVLLPLSTLEMWHARAKRIFWTAWSDCNLIGYLTVLPLSDAGFAKTLRDDFDEKQLFPIEIVAYSREAPNHLFFSSIVVDPSSHGAANISRLLRRQFAHDILAMITDGFSFDRISAEALNERGAAMVESLGMDYLLDTRAGSKIFCRPLSSEALLRSVEKLDAKIRG